MVERSKLAALEFLMSKQPRGKVRIGASNGGVGASNIFVEVDKFQDKYVAAMEKGSSKCSKVHIKLISYNPQNKLGF